MVDRALIRPPSGRVGPVTADERKAIIAKSPFKGRYDQAIDPESAYEILQKRVARGGGRVPTRRPRRRRAAGRARWHARQHPGRRRVVRAFAAA